MFILSFMSLAPGDITMKILPCGISVIFLPVFSCRTFTVLQLIFKSSSTLNLFLCMVIKFHFPARSCPDLPTPFVEEAIFAPFYAAAPFVEY